MKIGFLGCGNMGGALARAISKNRELSLLVHDPCAERECALKTEIGACSQTAGEMAREADFLFLGVKPGLVGAVLAEIQEQIAQNKELCLVSMAAGVTLSQLASYVPEATAIIRIMPNTSVGVGAGMTVFAANAFVSEEKKQRFARIMAPTGTLDELAEGLIDAESAVAGSGPAFAYMFLDALADGGVLCGLARDKALLYAAKMLEGAARTYLASGKHPDALKDEVCSPGGSTIEGVLALEDGGLRACVANAIVKTCEKAKKLGKS